jgi:hypothetical protein
MDSQKLITDITALLKASGFDQVTSAPVGAGIIVSGQAGTGRALFQWIPQTASKVSGARVFSSASHGSVTAANVAVEARTPGFGALKELPAEVTDALVARSRAKATGQPR